MRKFVLFAACCLVMSMVLEPSESLGVKKAIKRVRREMPTSEEMMMYLEHINDARRMVNASDMNELMWHDDLADMAHDWAMMCSTDVPDEMSDYGYALAEGESEMMIEEAIEMFQMEMSSYTYETNTCEESANCHNYLQMVWSASMYLGCAHMMCESMNSTYFYVCLFSPSMSDGEMPYSMSGEPCSSCSDMYTECNDGLCAMAMMTGEMMTHDMNTGMMSSTTTSMMSSSSDDGNSNMTEMTTTAAATTSKAATTKKTTKSSSADGPDTLDSGAASLIPTSLLAVVSLAAGLLLRFAEK